MYIVPFPSVRALASQCRSPFATLYIYVYR